MLQTNENNLDDENFPKILVSFMANNNIIKQEYFPQKSTFKDVIEKFEETIKEKTIQKPLTYTLQNKKVFPNQKIIDVIKPNPNKKLLEIELDINSTKIATPNTKNIPLKFDSILIPKENPFRLINYSPENSQISTKVYPKEKNVQYELFKFNEKNSASCNSPKSLYMSGGVDNKSDLPSRNFWKINNQTFFPEHSLLPIAKANHSMIFIPDDTIFFVGGNGKETFYFNEKEHCFSKWADLNKEVQKPFLFYNEKDNKLYSYNDNDKCLESTDLNSFPIWKETNLYGLKKGEKYNCCYLKNNKILFFNKNGESFVYDIEKKNTVKNKNKFNENIEHDLLDSNCDKNFYSNNNFNNVFVPSNFEENKNVIVIDNKNGNLVKKEFNLENSQNFNKNFLSFKDNKNLIKGDIILRTKEKDINKNVNDPDDKNLNEIINKIYLDYQNDFNNDSNNLKRNKNNVKLFEPKINNVNVYVKEPIIESREEDIRGIIPGETEINVPNVKQPEVNIPSVNANVKINNPDIKIKSDFGDIKASINDNKNLDKLRATKTMAPGFNKPNIDAKIKAPEINVPTIKPVEIKKTEVTVNNPQIDVNAKEGGEEISGIIHGIKKTFEINSSEIKKPEVEVKPAKVEVNAPKVEVKPAKVEVNPPKVDVPQINAKVDVKPPQINAPKVEVKPAKVEVNAPKVEVKPAKVDVNPPKVDVPQINAKVDVKPPQINAPKVEVKPAKVEVNAPKVEVKPAKVDVNPPKVDVPKINAKVDVKPPKVEVNAPKVEIPKVEEPKLKTSNIEINTPIIKVDEPKLNIRSNKRSLPGINNDDIDIKVPNVNGNIEINTPNIEADVNKYKANKPSVIKNDIVIDSPEVDTNVDIDGNLTLQPSKVNYRKPKAKITLDNEENYNVNIPKVEILKIEKKKENIQPIKLVESSDINIPKVTLSPKNSEEKMLKAKFDFDGRKTVNIPKVNITSSRVNTEPIYDKLNDNNEMKFKSKAKNPMKLKKPGTNIVYTNEDNEDFSEEFVTIGRPFTLTQLMTVDVDAKNKIDLDENYYHTTKWNKNGGIKYNNYKLEDGESELTPEGEANIKLTDYELTKDLLINGNIDLGESTEKKPDDITKIKALKSFNISYDKDFNVDDINNQLGGNNEYEFRYDSEPAEVNIEIPSDLSQIPNSKYYAAEREKLKKIPKKTKKKNKLLLPPGQSMEATIGLYNIRKLLKEYITEDFKNPFPIVEEIKKSDVDLDKICDYKNNK